uniref:Baseplate protein J-like domain-containing protein n=1 Tax=candidate division CPR3 bacterium TaxID=2268181 RepID=A0A7C4R574_UNCC3
MNKVIYLEADEEIINIVDRLKNTKDDKIALVVPAGAILLSSAVNLRLLMDESKNIGKRISIVTTDPSGRNIASQIGFTVYENLSDAREIKEKDIEERERIPTYQRNSEKRIEEIEEKEESGDVFAYTDLDDDFEEENTEKPPKHQKEFYISEKSEPKKPQPKSQLLYTGSNIETSKKIKGIIYSPRFWIFSIIGFIITLFLLVFIFPKATVYLNVTANEETLNIGFNLSTNNALSDTPGKATLSANWETKDQESSVSEKATGKKNIGQKAKGTVTAFNRSGKTVTIASGTEFLTGDNKRYVITQSISVPGAVVSDFGELVPGKATGPIEASEGGSVFNIGPSRFYIPALSEIHGNLVYGQSFEDIGGGDDKEAVVVSKEDIENAKKKAQAEIENKLNEELGMKGDKIFIKGLSTLEITGEELSKKEGEEAEEFSMKLKGKFSFLTFDKNDFDKMFEDSIKINISNEKKLVGTGYRNVQWEVSKFDKDKKTGEVLAKVTILTATSINEDFLRSKIVTLNIQELRAVLSKYPEVELDRVRFFPPLLLSSIPSNEKNVNIKVDYVE